MGLSPDTVKINPKLTRLRPDTATIVPRDQRFTMIKSIKPHNTIYCTLMKHSIQCFFF